MLLEQAIPGHSLKQYKSLTLEESIFIYASLVKTLSAQTISQEDYTHAKSWCGSIDKINDPRIAKHLVEKAKQVRTLLFENTAS